MQPDEQTHQQDSLIEAVRQFQSWRASRQRGARIPHALWRSATVLAAVHGVSRVSTALIIDYYALKKRLDAHPTSAKRANCEPSHAPRFVEVPRAALESPLPSAITCAIEVEKPCHQRPGCEPGHSKLRIELQGVSLSDLHSLLRSMWSESA